MVELMALLLVCACARTFRVVLAVLIATALVRLCQHDVLVVATYSQIGEDAPGRDIPGHGGGAVRSTDDSFDDHPMVHTAEEGEYVENWYGESVEDGSWRVPVVADRRTMAKRTLLDPRGGGLSTSKRPPFPCNLPPGTCQQTETCCASACVTVSSNPSHCGRCGHMCSAKRECCSGKCRRLATDEKNCGRCGSRCPSGTECLFGLCGYSS